MRRWNSNEISPVHSGGGSCHLDHLDCHRLHDIHHLDAQVAHGGNNIISLGKNSCPQPPPRAQQFCNVIDCPVQWQASSWTKVIVVNTNKHTGTLLRASLPPSYRHQNKQDLVSCDAYTKTLQQMHSVGFSCCLVVLFFNWTNFKQVMSVKQGN